MNPKKNLFLLTAASLLIILSLYVYTNRYTLTAVLYQTLGSQDAAIEEFSEAVKYDPENAYAYYQLGLMYKDRGDFDKAEEVYVKLLDIFPDHPHANYDLGYIYREKKDYKRAMAQYRKE